MRFKSFIVSYTLNILAIIPGCDVEGIDTQQVEAKERATSPTPEPFPVEELGHKILELAEGYKLNFVVVNQQYFTPEVKESCEEVGAELISGPTVPVAGWNGCYVWACNYVGMGICCFDDPKDCCKLALK